MSYQEVTIIGYLGRAPEMRQTSSGQAVATFSLAANRRFRDAQGQLVKETTWFQVTAWDRQAENACQYLQKGNQVMVRGRLNPDAESGSPRIWERRDGSPAASYEVTAREIIYLGGQDASGEPSSHPGSSSSPDTDLIDPEIPF